MLETQQLHPTLAREVVGLRLWEKLDEATVAALRDLYAQYGVLVFRHQALSEAEFAAFCALFGPLERTVRSDWASPTTPEVTVISNLKDGLGRPIGGLGDGELQWHSDQSYMMKPATGAALYALELPAAGGETFWVDLRAAYAKMPRQLRAQIAGKRGIFDYAKRLGGYGRETDRQISDEARRLTPAVTHALIRAHPRPAPARSISIRRPPSASTRWIRPRAWRCWTRSTRAPPATNSSTRTNGRSATWCYGTTVSRCTGARRSTRARGA
jgi:taurine dioxygenase